MGQYEDDGKEGERANRVANLVTRNVDEKLLLPFLLDGRLCLLLCLLSFNLRALLAFLRKAEDRFLSFDLSGDAAHGKKGQSSSRNGGGGGYGLGNGTDPVLAVRTDLYETGVAGFLPSEADIERFLCSQCSASEMT